LRLTKKNKLRQRSSWLINLPLLYPCAGGP